MLADGRPDDPSVTFPFSFPVCAKEILLKVLAICKKMFSTTDN